MQYVLNMADTEQPKNGPERKVAYLAFILTLAVGIAIIGMIIDSESSPDLSENLTEWMWTEWVAIVSLFLIFTCWCVIIALAGANQAWTLAKIGFALLFGVAALVLSAYASREADPQRWSPLKWGGFLCAVMTVVIASASIGTQMGGADLSDKLLGMMNRVKSPQVEQKVGGAVKGIKERLAQLRKTTK